MLKMIPAAPSVGEDALTSGATMLNSSSNSGGLAFMAHFTSGRQCFETRVVEAKEAQPRK